MDNEIKSVIIIGGGLGGLALAQAFKRSNIRVTVYERDEELHARGQGYQIGLNGEGVKALRSLNLNGFDDLLDNELRGFSIINQNMEMLLELKTPPGDPNNGGLIYRWKLRNVLADNVTIVWNKKFSKYEEFPDKVVAYFEDGSTAEADFLVGADGARSKIRSTRTPYIEYVDIGIYNTGGVLRRPSNDLIPKISPYLADTMVRIVSNNGNSILVFRCKAETGEDAIIWAFSHPKSEEYPIEQSEIKKLLEEKAATVHPDILYLIQNTPVDDIMTPRIMGSTRVKNSKPLGGATRVTLLGDAAHAMTTHRGLGANTAFLDCIDLAKALQEPDWRSAIEKYQDILMKRGMKAVNGSEQSTQMLHLTSPIKCGLRNGFMSTISWIIWLKKAITG